MRVACVCWERGLWNDATFQMAAARNDVDLAHGRVDQVSHGDTSRDETAAKFGD